VVLTDAMADWPALAKWDRQYLLAALAGRPVGVLVRRVTLTGLQELRRRQLLSVAASCIPLDVDLA
jgi:hypothetical protein